MFKNLFLQVLDSVLSKILQVSERPSAAAGLKLLEQCLTFEPSDPLVLSELLSCVSALFVFLSMAPSTHLLTTVRPVLNTCGSLSNILMFITRLNFRF